MRCSVRHRTHYRRLVFARSQVSLASLLSGLSDRALCADRSPVNAGFSIRRTIIVNMHLTLRRRVQAWGDLHCLFPCVNHAQVDLKPPSTFRIPGTHNFCFHTRAWIPSSSVISSLYASSGYSTLCLVSTDMTIMRSAGIVRHIRSSVSCETAFLTIYLD